MYDADSDNPDTRGAKEFAAKLAEMLIGGELNCSALTVDKSPFDPCNMTIVIKTVRGPRAPDKVDMPYVGRYAPRISEKLKQSTSPWRQWIGGEPTFEGVTYPEETQVPADSADERDLIGAGPRDRPPEGTRDLDLDI